MKIAILGTGIVGQTFIQALAKQVDSIIWGTNDPISTAARPIAEGSTVSVGSWLKDFPNVRLLAFKDCGGADAYVNVSKGEASLAVLEAVGEAQLAGKTVIDLSNPLDFSNGFPPSLFVCDSDSLAEILQRRFPTVNIVKALNTMTASVMVNPASVAGGDHHVFLCGNDDAARNQVSGWLKQWFGWRNILDLGDLTAARACEMLLPLWLRIYQTKGSPNFQFKVVGLQG